MADAPMKTEGGMQFPKEAYAYTPSDSPGSWKLRLWLSPEARAPDPAIVGAACAALGPGFRGQKVEIPEADRAAVVAKVRAAWKKANPNKDPAEMPDAIKEGAKEGRRLMGKMKAEVKAAIDTLLKFLKWADYDDLAEEDAECGDKKPARKSQGFQLYADKAGKPRWVAWTTNAFADREQEIFTTKALEDEVARTDVSWPAANRGIWIWHVPGTEFGRTDWRGVVGRILVETGAFADTPRGRKALEYFQQHADDDYRMSHGYRYHTEDRKDAVYDWLDIVERSVLPGWAAANPWTQFESKEAEQMALSKEKRTLLEDIFGTDEAAAIIQAAEQKTKELEEQGVGFKADAPPTEAPAAPPAIEVAAPAPGLTEEGIKALAAAFAESPVLVDLMAGQKAAAEAVEAMRAEMAAQAERVAAVEKAAASAQTTAADGLKAALADLPRRAFYQASKAEETKVDLASPDGAKLLTAAGVGDLKADPNYPLNRPLK